MSPTEYALIHESEDKGFRQRVYDIAMYNYNGPHVVNGNWWQLHDIAMLAMTGTCERRDYGPNGDWSRDS